MSGLTEKMGRKCIPGRGAAYCEEATKSGQGGSSGDRAEVHGTQRAWGK